MNLTFNEEIFKNCRNKEQYFQYIEELVWLGREVQDNGIMAFESEKWQNVTAYEREAIDLLCEGRSAKQTGIHADKPFKYIGFLQKMNT